MHSVVASQDCKTLLYPWDRVIVQMYVQYAYCKSDIMYGAVHMQVYSASIYNTMNIMSIVYIDALILCIQPIFELCPCPMGRAESVPCTLQSQPMPRPHTCFKKQEYWPASGRYDRNTMMGRCSRCFLVSALRRDCKGRERSSLMRSS